MSNQSKTGLVSGQHYTIGQSAVVFKAVKQGNSLILKNLKNSYGNYLEGYRLQDQKLIPFYTGKSIDYQETIDLSALRLCNCKAIKVDMSKW